MVGSAEWGPGHVIADKFRLVQQLGQGGMGSVWSAEHLQLHSMVAVKLIDPSIAMSPDALARFMREAQAAAALRSPHVVQTFDYGVDGGVPFIAMELLEGQSLAQRLEQVGKLSVEETALIMTQVGRAISRAHDKSIVHRDLKPDNIFLVRNDEEEIAKVLDFGVAKSTGGALGTSSQTRTGAILGTPYYMSPEQAEGNRSIDHRTDIWAMGVIGFECVVGRRPFESEALGDLILQICVRPIKPPSTYLEVPAGFDEWFLKATDRDTTKRFASARELTAELRRVAGFRAETGRYAAGTGPIPGTARPSGGLNASTGGGRDGGTNAARAAVTAGGVHAVTPYPQGGPANPAAAPFTKTPGGALSAPNAPLNATTGGLGTVTNSGEQRARTPNAVIIGATIGALALAGGLAFVAFRSPSHPDVAPSSGEPAAQAPKAAVENSAAPATAEPVAPSALPPAVAPIEPSASAAPSAAPVAAPAPPAVAKPVAALPAKHAEKPAKPEKAKPATPPTAAKPHVDFGF